MYLPETGQIEQTRQLYHVGRIDIELTQEQFEHVLGHVVGNLEAHGRTEAAAREFAFEGLQQIFVAVLLDVEIRITGDSERVMLDDLHSGEQNVEVRSDQLFEREEEGNLVRPVDLVDSDIPVDIVGDFHPREMLARGVQVLHGDSKIQAQPADVRERMGGVHGERGEDGEDLLGEISGQPYLLGLVQIRPTDDRDAFGGKGGKHCLEKDLGLATCEFLCARRDQCELRPRRQPVGRPYRQPCFCAAFEAGDTNHVELVEIGREDRQELRSFEKRDRLVLGEGEYARIEIEPAQFAVEVSVGREPIRTQGAMFGRGGWCCGCCGASH